MCGIAGIYTPSRPADLDAICRSMISTIAHRGPDDSGVWTDAEAGMGLGHQRLSILDLSPLGHQPMHGSTGRYHIVYNGEVYNHLDLRKELKPLGHTFRGGSDTETILAAIDQWGLKAALNKFIGMFAIALWDTQDRTLSLVRDRLGIKPLYYGEVNGGLIFGSELKTLKAHPDFHSSVNREALTLFFRHNYIPAPFSIYTDAHKVSPGEIVVFDGKHLSIETYWDADKIWRNGNDNLSTASEQELTATLEDLLFDAVRKRMLSDVPIGAFLSGGIDSSTVAALMQKASGTPVRTFSIGFRESEYNEATYAQAVAAHLGTDHTSLYVTPQDMLDVIPSLPHFWDEPFADSSQIPTMILSRLTKEHVTVSLSGDGGDELFSGYDRYLWTQNVRNSIEKIPGPARKILKWINQLCPQALTSRMGTTGQRLRWRLDALTHEDFRDLYRYAVSHFKEPASFVINGTEPTMHALPPMVDQRAWMSLYDLKGYLPDDILTKVDRASMSVSLEARVPILDHRVVEFASTVPASMKIRNGQSKWLLRQVLYKHVPSQLVDRPKMGFGVPIGKWMRQDLREWCEDMLSPATLTRQGYLDAKFTSKIWQDYKKGNDTWQYYIWDILMFQAWLEEYSA